MSEPSCWLARKETHRATRPRPDRGTCGTGSRSARATVRALKMSETVTDRASVPASSTRPSTVQGRVSMSEDLLKELRELEVGTFEIEDVAEVGVYAADELLMLEDGTDLSGAT